MLIHMHKTIHLVVGTFEVGEVKEVCLSLENSDQTLLSQRPDSVPTSG